eukprot:Phypoly_transcript_01056.p1 GENE.Phypoly_transcript_01056~~Phypoly_transcript_01056.p1  ORF type:complete len:1229 (+),score=283.06 Phypoly_transcript_01056:43-3687(+)
MSRKRGKEEYFDEANKRRVITNNGARITLRNREADEWSAVAWRPASPPRFDAPPRPDYSRRYYEPQAPTREPQYYARPGPAARNEYRSDFRDPRVAHDPRGARDPRDPRIATDPRVYRPEYAPPPPPPKAYDMRFAPQHIDPRRDAPRHDPRIVPRHDPRYDPRHDPRNAPRVDPRHVVYAHDRRNDRRDPVDLRAAIYSNNAARSRRGNRGNEIFHNIPVRDARQQIRAKPIPNARAIINTNRQISLSGKRSKFSDVQVPNIDMGTVNKGELAQKNIEITNNGTSAWKFYGIEQRRKDANLKIGDQKGLCLNSLPLQFKPGPHMPHRELGPGKSYALVFEYNTEQIGSVHFSLFFHFDGGRVQKNFIIKVVDLADQALLAPSKPYKPLVVKNRTLPAIREKPQPSAHPTSTTEEPLLSRSARKQQARKGGNNNNSEGLELFDMALEDLLPTAEQPLNEESHSAKFQALLAIENKQMEVDIRMYDMAGVQLKKIPSQPTGYSLQVPGIAENRPSVLLRDIVYFKKSGDEKAKEFAAEVTGVSREDIDVKFDDSFVTTPQATYDVRFTFTKIFTHRMMRALQTPFPPSFLFPKQLPTSPPKTTQSLTLFNPELNEQQLSAVSRIVHSPTYDSPYVIFGPPGTGKTLTVVEAVAQLLQNKSNTILVCAPSNQACDVIIERLAQYPSLEDKNMYRLNAIQRSVEEVSDTVRRFCLIAGGSFLSPNGQLLGKYSLIVCTCIFAGVLVELRKNGTFKKQFSHIIVDEAGHGLEPEILVPISLRGPKTQVTIAGDPFQLGPTVRSNYARINGLEKSFLERLSELPPYLRYEDNGTLSPEIVSNNFHNPDYVTKLVRNYRSHPAILHLPNRMFYHGDLVESADHDMTHSLLTFQKLPSLKNKFLPFPIVFNGLQGEDTREGESPSFFNIMEISEVHKWINWLLEDNTLEPRVTLQDIGVITPFRKQVQKIRSLLSGRGKEAVKVGSVEDFQGQEKRIIIISGVRSSHTFVEFDRKHKLGLLENPKRFNVAVTRAKALLIVVANPEILALDENWLELIRYCVDNNSYTGVELPDIILHPPAQTTTSEKGENEKDEIADNTENGENKENGDKEDREGKEERGEDNLPESEKADDKEGSEARMEDEEKREERGEEGQEGQEVQDGQDGQEEMAEIKQEGQEEQGEGKGEGEEDESNIEDRDVAQELDIGSMVTGQEGPEWRGSF